MESALSIFRFAPIALRNAGVRYEYLAHFTRLALNQRVRASDDDSHAADGLPATDEGLRALTRIIGFKSQVSSFETCLLNGAECRRFTFSFRADQQRRFCKPVSG